MLCRVIFIVCVSLINIIDNHAFANEQILEGPGYHSTDDILSFIRTHPAATIKNLIISNRLIIPYEQETKEVNFNNVTFNQGIKISGDKENIGFYDCTFKSDADFYLANFNEFHAEKCIFQKDVDFHSVEANMLWLNKSVFNGHTIFVNIKIKGLLNLSDVTFEKTVDFGGASVGVFNLTRVRSNLPVMILWAQFGQKWLQEYYSWALAPEGGERFSRLRQLEIALQFWRNNFSQLGFKRDEREVNYELIRLRRNYFISKKNANWWASIILEIPSRYGTRPYRPLITGVFLIIIFGFIYWKKYPFEKKQEQVLNNKPLLIFSLLYSVDTFVPFVNITGVKSWGWHIASGYRWIELLERIVGLAVSTLAAYSIGSQVFW